MEGGGWSGDRGVGERGEEVVEGGGCVLAGSFDKASERGSILQCVKCMKLHLESN